MRGTLRWSPVLAVVAACTFTVGGPTGKETGWAGGGGAGAPGEGGHDGLPSCDLDDDGHEAASCGGQDCNDRDPTVYPGAPELCGDGVDQSCEGDVDEDCACDPGEVRDCWPGGEIERGTGTCRDGSQRCRDDGAGWEPCEGAVLPEVETCDGEDEDCDGSTDEGHANACGGCGDLPVEICGNGRDDDCDGRMDPPPCGCEEGSCQPCYDGPPGTLGRGICRGGETTCVTDPGAGTRRWGACVGQVWPEPETMGNALDDDCDGLVDEGGGEACSPNAVELCGNGEDDDCDGFVEETCLATAASQACYLGPPGTRGIGACTDGIQEAVGDYWGHCVGSVGPSDERCGDGVDSDCDGLGGPDQEEDVGCCVPAGPEVCNDADDDCDGLADEGGDCGC